MKQYYVYTHSDLKGNVFYVGKGKGRRAWEKRSGKAWENNYIVEVLFDNLSEREAFDCEAILIDSFGIENLANKKKESASKEAYSLKEYKLIQHAKDLVWIRDNIDKIDFKNKFIKEQMEILQWSIEFRESIQKEMSLLNS